MNKRQPDLELSEILADEPALVRAALSLGAHKVPLLSSAEKVLLSSAKGPLPKRAAMQLQELIAGGHDPLGDAFTRFRSPLDRRVLGATYTPKSIVAAMYAWASDQRPAPKRIVDPGAGSGRYLLAASKLNRRAELVGIEIDPLAALMTRANLAAAGLAGRSKVVLDDFRAFSLDDIDGSTLFIGNPPYVRHHQIGPDWKEWLARTAEGLDLSASKLAGLHVHFFAATALLGRTGDLGSYVTSAEWLDVNYGSLVRELLLGPLGVQSINLLSPESPAFSDAMTTSVISCFKIGATPKSVKLRQVNKPSELERLDGGRRFRRERLEDASRWTPLIRSAKPVPCGYVELGEICRVHRGAVTGANGIWVTDAKAADLPDSVLAPSVTRARELFDAGRILSDSKTLKKVVHLPEDLDIFDSEERKLIDTFLRKAKDLGVTDGYVARHRRRWWALGLREPAPILATYMARRSPAFVRNLAEARNINIAHGLYPRQELSPKTLDLLASALREGVSVSQGRTYAGGLTKFEPREMERIPINMEQILLN